MTSASRQPRPVGTRRHRTSPEFADNGAREYDGHDPAGRAPSGGNVGPQPDDDEERRQQHRADLLNRTLETGEDFRISRDASPKEEHAEHQVEANVLRQPRRQHRKPDDEHRPQHPASRPPANASQNREKGPDDQKHHRQISRGHEDRRDDDRLAPYQTDDNCQQRPRHDIVDRRAAHCDSAGSRLEHVEVDEDAGEHGQRGNRQRDPEEQRERERRRRATSERREDPGGDGAADRERNDQTRGRDPRHAARMTSECRDVELEPGQKHEHENGARRDRRDHGPHVGREQAIGETRGDESEYGRSERNARGKLADDGWLTKRPGKPARGPGDEDDEQRRSGWRRLKSSSRPFRPRAKQRQDSASIVRVGDVGHAGNCRRRA